MTRERYGFSRRLSLSDEDLSLVEGIFSQLDRELEQQTPGYQFSSTLLFMRLLLYLSRSFDSSKEEGVQDLLLLSRLTGAVKEYLS